MLKYSPDGDSFVKSRVSLQCVTNVFSLTGLCMILAAMFTSGWQISYYSGRKGIFEHGLYKDCVQGQDNIYPYEDWVCFWKFDQNNHIETDRFFKLRDYQVSVMVIFGASCLFAVITMFCACCTCCSRVCNIPWAVCALLTAVLAIVGIGIFGFNASISDNRFIRMDNYEVDMIWGYSFYIAIAGAVCHFLAMILACLCVALAFTERRRLSAKGRMPAASFVTVPKQTVGSGTMPNYASNVKTAPAGTVINGQTTTYAMPATGSGAMSKQSTIGAAVPNYALNDRTVPIGIFANDRSTAPNYATGAIRSFATNTNDGTYGLGDRTVPIGTSTSGRPTTPNYFTGTTRPTTTSKQTVTYGGSVPDYTLSDRTAPIGSITNGRPTTPNYFTATTRPATISKQTNTYGGAISDYALNVRTMPSDTDMNGRTTPNYALNVRTSPTDTNDKLFGYGGTVPSNVLNVRTVPTVTVTTGEPYYDGGTMPTYGASTRTMSSDTVLKTKVTTDRTITVMRGSPRQLSPGRQGKVNLSESYELFDLVD